MAASSVSTSGLSGTKARKLSLTGLPIPALVHFLVIAGSGGSGSGYGGAGGYRASYSGGSGLSGRNSSLLSAIAVSEGTSYTVSVGGGGAAGTGWPIYRGTNGVDSTFATVTSSGGGAGGGNANHTEKNGRNGGAGGGGGHYYGGASGGSGYAGQGFDGQTTTQDHAQGVGGGAGGTPAGLASTITGTSVVRATGNGGGANSGSGASPNKQNGNSGVVILRFEGKQPSVSAGLTYSISKDGADTVMQFTAGSGTVTW